MKEPTYKVPTYIEALRTYARNCADLSTGLYNNISHSLEDIRGGNTDMYSRMDMLEGIANILQEHTAQLSSMVSSLKPEDFEE